MERALKETANLIFLKGRLVFLVRRGDDEEFGKWALPGGGVEKERVEAALRREIEEELSCKVKKISFFKSFFYKNVKANYFFGELAGEVALNEENSEFGWFDIDDLPEMAFNQREVLGEISDWPNS